MNFADRLTLAGGELALLLFGLGLLGLVLVALSRALDRWERLREIREAALEEQRQTREVRARMHGWVPR